MEVIAAILAIAGVVILAGAVRSKTAFVWTMELCVVMSLLTAFRVVNIITGIVITVLLVLGISLMDESGLLA